jgi:hypothetical protein
MFGEEGGSVKRGRKVIEMKEMEKEREGEGRREKWIE